VFESHGPRVNDLGFMRAAWRLDILVDTFFTFDEKGSWGILVFMNSRPKLEFLFDFR
jgi:hypothetical protein